MCIRDRPLTVETIKRIIDIEKPDSVLANMGGQTGLNIGMELSEGNFLSSRGVKLLGVNPETIRKAEDRQAFKDTMLSIGEPCIPSKVVESVEDALDYAHVIGYPVVVRPADVYKRQILYRSWEGSSGTTPIWVVTTSHSRSFAMSRMRLERSIRPGFFSALPKP